MKRPLAYITAPWSNSQYENAENAAAYCRQVYDAGYSPICPVLFLPTFLKDEIPQEHKDGLDMARDYLRRSHVLVVCGHGIGHPELLQDCYLHQSGLPENPPQSHDSADQPFEHGKRLSAHPGGRCHDRQ